MRRLFSIRPLSVWEAVPNLLLLLIAASLAALTADTLVSPSETPVATIFDNWLIVLVVVFIAAPITEEVIFRGYVLHSLQAVNKGTVAPMVMTSAAFSMLHPYQGFLHVFMVSLWLCSIKIRTGSLLTCAMVHAVHNISIYWLAKFAYPLLQEPLLALVSPILTVAGAAAIYAVFLFLVYMKHKSQGSLLP